MQCPICGHTNDGANRFCEYCGSRLDPNAQQEATVAGKAACPNCGANVTPGEAFCDACGTALPHSSNSSQDAASYDAPTMFVPSDLSLAAETPGSPTAASTASSSGGAAEGNLVCSVCGYANQPGDRFCDQCGASLQAPSASSAATAQPAAGPASGTDDQTVVGAPVPSGSSGADDHTLYGELAPIGPSSDADDRTVIGAPAPTGASLDDQTVIGAPLPGVASGADDQTVYGQPAPGSANLDDQTVIGAPSSGDRSVSSEAPTPPQGMPVVTPPAASSQSGQESAARQADPDQLLKELVTGQSTSSGAESGAAAASATPPESTSAQPDQAAPAAAPVAADRSALEATVQEQRDNLGMFEQMAGRYQGRALPNHIQLGLDESRAALQQAEDDLAAFDAAQSTTVTPPDPAEVERLTNLVQEQRDNLGMFEQMAGRYQGRELPGHIQLGLFESRSALEQAEADLAALHGGQAPLVAPPQISALPETEKATLPSSISVPPAAATSAPSSAPASTPATQGAPGAMPSAPVSDQSAPAAMPTAEAQGQPAPMPVVKPRLMVEPSGVAIELPDDKQLIVVGREDPISGIFPEVDLTPHGGETGGVSRQHARILHNGDEWQVEDLNSTNYTKVNGTKLAPNTPTVINDGDKLHFGRVAMTFHKA